jgi:hypothetical protein
MTIHTLCYQLSAIYMECQHSMTTSIECATFHGNRLSMRHIHKLPKEGTTPKFKNVKYGERVPCVIYADFECLTPTIEPPVRSSDVAVGPPT